MIPSKNQHTESEDTFKKITLHDREIAYVLSIGLEMNKKADSWKDYVNLLSETELEYCRQKITPEAKNSFCLGRMAAKKALSEFRRLPYEQISIETGVFGYPVFEPNAAGFGLSIGHTERAGIAVCYSEKLLCGIDIEFLDANKTAIMQSVFTDEELKLQDSVTIGETEFLHLLWTAREALSKAIKTGFLIPIILFEVSEIAFAGSHYVVLFKNFPLMKVIVFKYNGYFIALAIPSKLRLESGFGIFQVNL